MARDSLECYLCCPCGLRDHMEAADCEKTPCCECCPLKKDDRAPLDDVMEDMCCHEVGWIREAAEAYYHREYLGEVHVKDPDRKWWQFWKPRYIWAKKDGDD